MKSSTSELGLKLMSARQRNSFVFASRGKTKLTISRGISVIATKEK